MNRTPPASSEEEATSKYVCGIDIGSQSCAGCMCLPDKSVVIKAITFANTKEGWHIWEEKLNQLDAPPSQILIGMEATSRYGENLYHELEQRGYVLRLLHPGQTHHFHQQRSLRAKTDRLDAMTIERRVVEWGGTHGLCARRTSSYVSGTGALAYATRGYSRRLSKRDPSPGRSALPRIHPGLCRSLLAHCSVSAQSLPECSGAGRSRGRTPCPGVTSTARSARRAPDRKETGGPGQSEREQWASESRTIDQLTDSL
jgi:transposase